METIYVNWPNIKFWEIFEHQFDKREMTDSDFDFYPGNWKNPLGYTHFCFWNHQNPLFRPQNSPLKFSPKN